MYRKLLHWIRVGGACIVQTLLRVVPIRSNILVFYVHKRKGLCCNPKYIMKYMISVYPEAYKYYWATDYPDSVPENEKYRIIRIRSLYYYWILSQAKILITNDMIDETLIKRKGQLYLCTWHGGGTFKRSAFDIKEAEEISGRLKRWYGRLDYLVLSNGFLEKEYKRSFRISETRMLKTGMPRSDVFFQRNDFYRQIRQLYQIDSDTKILLYAPTYRYEKYELLSYENILSILEKMEQHFGGKWVCFYRMHYFDLGNSYPENRGKIYDGSSYVDVQEFLCATDILITDYSSLLWDFSLLKRPCFSFAKSPEEFEKNERGFYLPYKDWPYPKAKAIDELLDIIDQFDEEKYRVKLELYIDKVNSFEKGNSTELVVKNIMKLLTGC